MEEEKKTKRIIPDLIAAINEAEDESTITYYENIMVSVFAIPLLALGAVSNFIIRRILWNEDLKQVLADSLVFLLLAVLFEIICHTRFSASTTTYIVSALYSVWFVFVAVKYYSHLSQAVIMMAAVQLILALMRITDTMLVFMGASAFLTAVFIWIGSIRQEIKVDLLDLAVQSGLFIVLIMFHSPFIA